MAIFSVTTDILPYLQKYDDVVAVYLFGSQVKGSIHKESDTDVAILTREAGRPSAEQLFHRRVDLEELLNAKVDLILLNTASPIVVHQVLKSGKLLWCGSASLLARFVMRAQSEYTDLKILRRPAEAAILKRKIYG